MNGLKIFLENRMILLLGAASGQAINSAPVIVSPTRKDMVMHFQSFEKDPLQKQLVFMRPDDQEGLQQQFITMFDYVEAAGGKVLNEKGELLMIFRYGRWDLPKGKINTRIAEVPLDAAVREVKEETGLSVLIPGKEIESTWHIFSHKGRRILKHTYWFAMTAPGDQPLVPQTEEDISIVRWVPADQLPEMLSNTYASLADILHLG